MRHSLSDKSVQAATVLGSWCVLPGAIPHKDILASFDEKHKRPKGSEKLQESSDDVIEIE